MASRFGGVTPGSPALAPSSRSVGGYSLASNYSSNTSIAGMYKPPLPPPGYQQQHQHEQMSNGGGSPHTPSTHGNGGQSRSGGSRRPDKKDTKEVAWVHWRALKEFLATWIDKESPSARQSAREKLTRLTRLQFLELSTDVYDELMRRNSVERGSADNAAPFLPVRDDFHPKRNQARQKLATLPKNRFKDLASDVFFELRRRYPEFADESTPEKKAYEEPPAPGPMPVHGYSSPSPQPYKHQPTGSTSSLHKRDGSSGAGSATAHPAHHRQGSSMGRSMGDDAGEMETLTNGNDQPYSDRDRLANFTAATNDVVVPTKSRLQEEEIEVPYARDSTIDVDHGPPRITGISGLRDPRSESRTSERARATATPSHESAVTSPAEDQYYDQMSFAGTSVRGKPFNNGSPSWEEQEKKLRQDYEQRIAALERRAQLAEDELEEQKRQLAAALEQRKDYEDEVRSLKERATTHASSLRSLQHELDLSRDASDVVRAQSSQTSKQAQEEIQQWRERCEGLEDELRRLEEEKNDRATQNARSPVDDSLVGELQKEVRTLVDELNSLSLRNDELVAAHERDAEATAALETKMEEYKRQYNAARTELRNLKATSTMFVSKPLSDDHLPASADGNIADSHVTSFQQAIDGLLQAARSSHPSGVLPAMKAIVEATTLIGDDVKAFEESPNLDVDASRLEQLKHESSTCLSGLMNAARNHAMASGLAPVSLIDAAAGHLSVNVVELIKLLKIRRSGKTRDILNTRISMSIGEMVRRGSGHADDDKPTLSPVQEHDRRSPNIASPLGTGTLSAAPPSAYDHRIHSFQSVTSTAQRSDSFALEQNLQRQSSASVSTTDHETPRPLPPRPDPYSRAPAPPQRKASGPIGNSHSRVQSLASVDSGSGRSYDGYGRQPYGQPGSSPMPTPSKAPPANGQASSGGGNEKEWENLKPYLNTQSSTLVNAIQNLLAAIRTGGQGPALNEHLSEVIAISTSIVAVSSDALPQRLRSSGDGLLSDLTANTTRLSEAQSTAAQAGGFDKALRQGIASASFGVAKALKALMKLGD